MSGYDILVHYDILQIRLIRFSYIYIFSPANSFSNTYIIPQQFSFSQAAGP